MPILLNEIGKQSVKEYTPKFFNSKLTGAGKSVGLLNKDLNPANAKKKNSMVDLGYNSDIEKKKYTNGLSEVTCIPLYTIPFYSEHEIKEIPPKDLDTSNMVQIATHNNSTKILFDMEPRYIILEEIQPSTPSGKISKDVTICYDMSFYMDKNLPGDIEAVYNVKLDSFETYVKGMIPLTTNKLHRMMCTDIYDTLAKAYEILKDAGYDVDVAAADSYLGDYSVYERICMMSERWQTKIHEDIELLLTNMHMARAPHRLSAAAGALSHLEKYAVPLDLYKDIYKSITSHFDSDIVEMLCKQNLNLLLSSTLDNLNKNKSTLMQLSAPATPPAIDPMFSTEQIRAITTTEPLALVQAGAGSGKSTVVLARIKYMVDCGVAPEDITVLSFTNAAADNITAKNPNVHSMTIAKMIHLIYSTNFTDHELSSLDTIINSLDIEYPNDPFAYDFRKKLSNLRKNDNNCFTEMNDFIEKNYDEVIAVLDKLGQTTLELEIIICYQKISQFTEPPEVQSKYLIIDEVQDNSIFEFIYALKYVEKHKESLFMVGRL